MTDTLTMMLIVGLTLSFTILWIFIWGAKQGQFDDSEKMMGGLLFDSQEDLSNILVEDGFATNIFDFDHSNPDCSADVSTGIITCDNISLSKNESKTITYKLIARHPGQTENDAVISGAQDSNSGNNSSSLELVVNSPLIHNQSNRKIYLSDADCSDTAIYNLQYLSANTPQTTIGSDGSCINHTISTRLVPAGYSPSPGLFNQVKIISDVLSQQLILPVRQATAAASPAPLSPS